MIAPGPLKFVQVSNQYDPPYPLWGGPVHFIGMAGIGIPPTQRQLTTTPLQHGLLDRGFRIDARKLTLNLLIAGNDPPHADVLRDQIVRAFTPLNGPLTLSCTREDDETRHIDVFVDGEIDFPTADRSGAMQTFSVPLIAPDFAWYDPTQVVDTIVASSAATSLDCDVNVSGLTWRDYPVVEVAGEVNQGSQLIFWPAQRVILPFELSGIPNGETWVFDFRPASRGIYRKSDGANRMPVFTRGPHVSVITGPGSMTNGYLFTLKETRTFGASDAITNTISIEKFSGNAVEAGASITVKWYRRFISL